MAAKELHLTTTVGGKFDLPALVAALAELGPFEPEHEYVLTLQVADPPAAPAGGDEV
jgi:hypothetical protein